MRTGVFVQARLHSTRLPYKMLLPFPGGSLIQHVLRAARKIEASAYALLVPNDDMVYFEYYAKKEGFDLLGGPEEDVYGRFVGALNHYKDLEFVVRVTGDKALLSPAYTQRALDFMTSQYYNAYAHLNWVYFAHPPLNQVTGDVLYVPKLLALYKPEIPDSWREHIITAFQYNSLGCEVPEPMIPPFRNANLTVDTEDDYRRLMEVYKCFYKGEVIELDTIMSAVEVFAFRGN